jgi:hypothetical protein
MNLPQRVHTLHQRVIPKALAIPVHCNGPGPSVQPKENAARVRRGTLSFDLGARPRVERKQHIVWRPIAIRY